MWLRRGQRVPWLSPSAAAGALPKMDGAAKRVQVGACRHVLPPTPLASAAQLPWPFVQARLPSAPFSCPAMLRPGTGYVCPCSWRRRVQSKCSGRRWRRQRTSTSTSTCGPPAPRTQVRAPSVRCCLHGCTCKFMHHMRVCARAHARVSGRRQIQSLGLVQLGGNPGWLRPLSPTYRFTTILAEVYRSFSSHCCTCCPAAHVLQ